MLKSRNPLAPTFFNMFPVTIVSVMFVMTAIVPGFAVAIQEEALVDPVSSDNFYEARTRMWLPEDRSQIRGLLVLVGGTDSDWRGQVSNRKWQNLAKQNKLGLIGCYFRGDGEPYEDAAGGSGTALLRMMDNLVKRSRHPELANTPFIIVGYSSGAMFAYNFACWKPERIGAIVAIKSGPVEPAKAAMFLHLPALFIVGENDEAIRKRPILQIFQLGTNVSWVLAIEPNSGHELDSNIDPLIQEYISGVVHLSLESGEGCYTHLLMRDLRHPGTLPVSGYDKNDVMKLPSAESAAQWARFTKPSSIKTEARSSNDPPRRLPTFSPSELDMGTVSIEDFKIKGLHKRIIVSLSSDASFCEFFSDEANLNLASRKLGKQIYELDISIKPQDLVLSGQFTASVTAIVRVATGSVREKIPVRGIVESPAVVTPPCLYLGVLRRGEIVERQVEIKWPKKYVARIDMISASRPDFVSTAWKPSINAAIITCKFIGGAPGNASGVLEIMFDGGHETKRVPFIGWVAK